MIPAEHLDTYARLLVEHAVSLRPDQDLYVRGSSEHDDFALRVGEAAYGIARSVSYHLVDAERLAQLIRRGTPEQIELYCAKERAFHAEIIEKGGALIYLSNHYELPEPVQEAVHANPRGWAMFIQNRQEIFSHLAKPTTRRLFAATSAPAATPRWANKLFPTLEEATALERLWRLLLGVSLADRSDALEHVRARAATQRQRETALNQLGITALHITGNGNDLKLALSRRARWVGTGFQTASGQSCYPNFPSEEIFTAPDRRKAEGRLVASHPLRLYNGIEIDNLVLEFRAGRVVAFQSDNGREAFAKWLQTDDGARRLGEIGLVSQDSGISRAGTRFDFNNLDENTAAHLALGQTLPFTIENSENLTETELQALGWNRSAIHTDVLFGSEKVTIRATRSRVGEVVLIDEGRWGEGL
ncbi:MAG: aminopeptidase [Thermoanaerobaculia bacterium]|nr:aminopeptidase [Thermoanaerobaculia bacterium]